VPGGGGTQLFDDVLPDADRREEEQPDPGEEAPGPVPGDPSAFGAAGVPGHVPAGGGTQLFDDVLPDADRGEEEQPDPGEDAPGSVPADAAVTEKGGPSGPTLLDDVLPDADKVEKEKKPRRRGGKDDGDRLV
jgi:hypothetical protein